MTLSLAWWLVFAIVPISKLSMAADRVGFAYYMVQKKYRFSAREVKRLDSITKSPMFQFFSETVQGLETIRAFR